MWTSRKRYERLLQIAGDASLQVDKLQKQLNDLRDRTEPKISIWVRTGGWPSYSGEYIPAAKIVEKILEHLGLFIEAVPRHDADVRLIKKGGPERPESESENK